jgi:hypothetical protein
MNKSGLTLGGAVFGLGLGVAAYKDSQYETAKSVATDAADALTSQLDAKCGLRLKTPLTPNSFVADSSEVSADLRMTIDAYNQQETDCLNMVLAAPISVYSVENQDCEISLSAPNNWHKTSGGVQVHVIVDCLQRDLHKD